jgi:hypothetical protein
MMAGACCSLGEKVGSWFITVSSVGVTIEGSVGGEVGKELVLLENGMDEEVVSELNRRCHARSRGVEPSRRRRFRAASRLCCTAW